MPKEYYLYVNGKKVKVSEELYKVYWQEKEHERYLKQVDKKNHLLFFSSIKNDKYCFEKIIDESVDIERIVETKIIIETLRKSLSKLSDEEREIIKRLYFDDETMSGIAKDKEVSYQAIQCRKNNRLYNIK